MMCFYRIAHSAADFLQVKSMKDQEQYWAENEKPYRILTPRQFAEAFQMTEVGISLVNKLATS